MFTGLAKDMVENWYKVWVAVRIAIFPPWKIEDVEGHSAINLGSLAFLGVLYLAARQFTPEGSFGLGVTTVVTVFTFVFLLLCGIVISALDPTKESLKLTNRWSTFLIVSFMYATIAIILAYVLPPLMSSSSFNLFESLAKLLRSEIVSYLFIASVAAVLAVGFLYWRARRWFRDALRMQPAFLGLSLLLCVFLDAALIYVFIFAI
jgi:hypothetical protein